MRMMSLEKLLNDDLEEVCGNCFWVQYCFSQFKGVFVDSPCLFQPSAFERVRKNSWGGNLLAQSPEAAVLPEGFFEAEDETRRESQLSIAEKYLLIDALMRKQWSQKRAAEYLGVSQRTINYLCRKHGVRHPNWWRYHPPFSEKEKEK